MMVEYLSERIAKMVSQYVRDRSKIEFADEVREVASFEVRVSELEKELAAKKVRKAERDELQCQLHNVTVTLDRYVADHKRQKARIAEIEALLKEYGELADDIACFGEGLTLMAENKDLKAENERLKIVLRQESAENAKIAKSWRNRPSGDDDLYIAGLEARIRELGAAMSKLFKLFQDEMDRLSG
jgi:regulator of replication initiation timing